jgi:ferredoxin-NADP reductase
MIWIILLTALILSPLPFIIMGIREKMLIARLKERNNDSIELRIIERKEITPTIFELTLSHPKGKSLPSFQPGQYLTLEVPLEGQCVKRCYSLADWNNDCKCYRLAIKKEDNGIASSWLHQNATEGKRLKVQMPQGHFVLKEKGGSVVLVAGGIGITPMRSMLHACLKSKIHSGRNIFLFYSARYYEELCYMDEFNGYQKSYSNFSFIPVLTSPDKDWQGMKGRLTAERILSYLGNSADTYFYFCAKQQMMDELMDGLKLSGIPSSNLLSENFGINVTSEDNTCYKIRLDLWEGTYQKNGTLYNFLEEKGLQLDGDCRAGQCGKCRMKLKSGSVKNLLTDPENDETTILLCCSIPVSDIKLERLG